MNTRALPALFAAGAVAAQIVYPLVSGGTRDVVTFAVVALLAAACAAHAAVSSGVAAAVKLVVLTAGIGLLAEIIGSSTGYPFGCYSYAQGRIGPSIADVPIIVPFAWTAGMYPVWCVSKYVSARVGRNARVTRLALTVAGVVGWDFYLDPQMVSAGLWTWCSPHASMPGLDGIPYTNYLGWTLVALIMAVGMELIDRPQQQTDVGLPAVPTGLFLWTWLGSSLAHAVFLPELGWSALYGLVAMGVVGVPLLVSLGRRHRTPVH